MKNLKNIIRFYNFYFALIFLQIDVILSVFV